MARRYPAARRQEELSSGADPLSGSPGLFHLLADELKILVHGRNFILRAVLLMYRDRARELCLGQDAEKRRPIDHAFAQRAHLHLPGTARLGPYVILKRHGF